VYRGAEFGVYVSLHEGFGLPPLECLACGTPVIVSAGLGLDDAWPDYPYRVAGMQTAAIAAEMCNLLDDPDAAAGVVEGAPGRLEVFDWEQSSRLLLAELDRVSTP
jgi:glycosyltransferase involved in cell wall biosynthesis